MKIIQENRMVQRLVHAQHNLATERARTYHTREYCCKEKAIFLFVKLQLHLRGVVKTMDH